MSATPFLTFDSQEYDVTQLQAKIQCCASQILMLEPEEVILKSSICCGVLANSEKRMPYGELGSVDQTTACCGLCHGFSSDLNSVNPKTGQKTPFVPGCGCDAALVETIVDELKKRMKVRGNTGNIQRSEEAYLMMKYLEEKLELLLKKQGVPVPQKMAGDGKECEIKLFEHQDYNVSTYPMMCCCISKVINLDAEEVHTTTKTPCAVTTQRFPYGKLGDVTTVQCCCSTAMKSEHLGLVSPGCGCDKSTVTTIANELKARMRARGDTGNIVRQEYANAVARDTDKMIDALLNKAGISVPAKPAKLKALEAPVPQTM
jgi:hypothetical protein